jgi:hypothetical protein
MIYIMPVNRNIFLDRILKHLKIKNPLDDKKIKKGGDGEGDGEGEGDSVVGDVSYTDENNDEPDMTTKITGGFYIFDVLSGDITGLVISNGNSHLYVPKINEININEIETFIKTGTGSVITTDVLITKLQIL